MLRRGLFFGLLLGTLAPASASAALLDANCPGPPNAMTTVGQATQTFTTQRTGGIVTGQMFLNKTAGADFAIEIYKAGAAGPTGSPLGSASIADSAIPNSVTTPVTGTFATPVPVTAGGAYAISLRRTTGSFVSRDRTGDPCPGNEFSLTGPDTWTLVNPTFDYPFETLVEPSNDIVVGSQVGRTLTVNVPNAGTVSLAGVAQAVGGKTSAAAKKKKKPAPQVLIAPAQATAAAPGDVALSLVLTKPGTRLFKRKGKVASGVTLTYTPTGGLAKSTTMTVSFKKAKKKKKG